MKNKAIKDFRSFYKSQNPFKMTSFDDKLHKMSEARGYINPYIMIEKEMNMSQLDIFSKMMTDRIIFFNSEVNDDVCGVVMAQLLYLDSEEEKDIKLYINSPGGSVSAGLGVVSVMDFINSDVSTVNLALAASMGSILLMSGTKGKRYALKYSKTLLHQPLSGMNTSQESDIAIHAAEMAKCKKQLYDIIVECTGQSYERIEKDADRDFWLTAEEALTYGCVDEVIRKK